MDLVFLYAGLAMAQLRWWFGLDMKTQVVIIHEKREKE